MLKSNKNFGITINTKTSILKLGDKVLLHLINIKTY